MEPGTLPSILFPDAEAAGRPVSPLPPDFFADLHLDAIVAAVVAGKEEYRLEPFFYQPLRGRDAIAWRQAVMRDLEGAPLFAALQAFAAQMRAMRACLAQAAALDLPWQKQRWFLDATAAYGAAVTGLAGRLTDAMCASPGMAAFRAALLRYAASANFGQLRERTRQLANDFANIHYTIFIHGIEVTVRRHSAEPDASQEIAALFRPFQSGPGPEHRFAFRAAPEADPVEEKILARVALLYPEAFAALERFCTDHQNWQDPALLAFDREIQFYVACVEFTARLRHVGLPFCYPAIAEADKEVASVAGFDLALASQRLSEPASIVRNDFHFGGPERILVVTGPNQGGKTTFARSFGQLHFWASLGCAVPGTSARLFLFDQIFTHFEQEEDARHPGGQLEHDLLRIHDILRRATAGSILILNEVLAATTLRDAIALSRGIAAQIAALGALCVWVTFVDELASWGPETVSMAPRIDPAHPELRTYEIIRRPADGLAYAMAIAEKYQLSYAMIQERLLP